MASRILVQNLPGDMTEEGLKNIFAQIGEVQSVKLKTDLITRQSKGCGFVEMSLDIDAYRAVNCFNGATFKDRKIHLQESEPLLQRAVNFITTNVNIKGLGFILSKEKSNH